MTDEEAVVYIQQIIDASAQATMAAFMEQMHKLAQVRHNLVTYRKVLLYTLFIAKHQLTVMFGSLFSRPFSNYRYFSHWVALCYLNTATGTCNAT